MTKRKDEDSIEWERNIRHNYLNAISGNLSNALSNQPFSFISPYITPQAYSVSANFLAIRDMLAMIPHSDPICPLDILEQTRGHSGTFRSFMRSHM